MGSFLFVFFYFFLFLIVFPQIILSFIPQQIREGKTWSDLAKKYPSLSARRKIRRIDAFVIVVVWVITLVQDLFVAVISGIVLTSLYYTHDVGERLSVIVSTVKKGPDTVKIYQLKGPLFFSSAQRFVQFFQPATDPDIVEVHFDRDDSALCDYSGIHAINVVGEKYKKYGKKLFISGLNYRGKKMLSKSKTLNRHFTLVDTESHQPSLVTKMF